MPAIDCEWTYVTLATRSSSLTGSKLWFHSRRPEISGSHFCLSQTDRTNLTLFLKCLLTKVYYSDYKRENAGLYYCETTECLYIMHVSSFIHSYVHRLTRLPMTHTIFYYYYYYYFRMCLAR